MEVTHYFDTSLTSSHTTIVPVMQGDGTRIIVARLTEGTKPWIVPEGVTAGLSYEIPKKIAGYYDRLDNGQPACTICGNEVTVFLDPALTEQSGPVHASIILRGSEDAQVSTFPFLLWVTPVPGMVHKDNLPAPTHAFDGKLYYGGSGGTLIPLGLGNGIKAERQENGSLLLVADYSSSSTANQESDPTVPGWAKQSQKPAYTAEEVGADPRGTAENAITGHDKAKNSHGDIRQELTDIRDQLLAFLDTDEDTLDQLSELISAIMANKTSVDALTTGKINTSDIIDNLSTNSAHKPLSAAQGVILKELVAGKLDAAALPGAIDTALAESRETIVQQVIAALGTPVFGRVDADNNIILTGELVAGTYAVKYEDAEGNLLDIGTLDHDGADVPAYTNVIPSAIGEDGAVFNGTGYIDGYRLTSNYNTNAPHYVSVQSGYFVTGFFPYTIAQCKDCVPFYVKGVNLDTMTGDERMAMYSDHKSTAAADTAKLNNTAANGFTITKLGDMYYKITPKTNLHTYGGVDVGWGVYNATVARFSFPGSGTGVILTVNEPIE